MGIALEEIIGMKKLSVDLPPILSQLTALTPHDGRYVRSTHELTNFCSEAGLQRFRTFVEIKYLIFNNQELINAGDQESILSIYRDFDLRDALRIKEIESEINHDVKAVEYFICEKLVALDMAHLKPKVHKFLTSEDVTNVAIGLMVYASRNIISVEIQKILDKLKLLAQKWKGIPMLARTHGQPASPTTVGKEFIVFVNRLDKVHGSLMDLPIEVKWNGATGNYNAHRAAEPERNWIEFSQNFIQDQLGLTVELFTGQTSNYLYLADILHQLKNFSSILIDLARDMWMYISYDNFKLKLKKGEVGSSTMPHKVNPINFENAEGNLEMAEVLFGFMASKLQKSRMQRDLSDSTALRNLGLMFGSVLIGIKSLSRGLSQIDINEKKIINDLNNNPAVISEAIQSIMRHWGIEGGYEQLKTTTRGQAATFEDLRAFIYTLKGQLPDDVLRNMDELTPQTYTGDAEDLVEYFLHNYC